MSPLRGLQACDELSVGSHPPLNDAAACAAEFGAGHVDCASFIVIEERGIAEAFASDHDFE